MPMAVRWHSHHPQIMVWEVDESFTLEEFYQCMMDVRDLLEERQPDRYHIITDVRKTREYPRGLLQGFRSGHARASDAYCGTVMVGAPIFVRSFVGLLQRLSIGKNQYAFADDFDEAVAIATQRL
ncbi:MAG: hypothetical protein AAFV33_22450, partial [Chloroflexota bacterium]